MCRINLMLNLFSYLGDEHASAMVIMSTIYGIKLVIRARSDDDLDRVEYAVDKRKGSLLVKAQ